jgi:hypothetical protein
MTKETAGEAVADTFLRWSLEDETGEELDGWIYIVGCYEPEAIKIGFTRKDPRDRLKQLQTGNPTKLFLFGWYPGSQREERRLHQQMERFRLSGEWFRVHADANEIMRGPIHCMLINNALTGYKPPFDEDEVLDGAED